nr:immunoglobulin heavy chain junction region [Mus musculus]
CAGRIYYDYDDYW